MGRLMDDIDVASHILRSRIDECRTLLCHVDTMDQRLSQTYDERIFWMALEADCQQALEAVRKAKYAIRAKDKRIASLSEKSRPGRPQRRSRA